MGAGAEAGTLVENADATLLLLAAAVLAAELFPLDVPSRDEQVTFSTPFAFALLLDRGTATTVIVVPLMLLIADTIRRRRAERTLFNVGQYAICYALAGGVLSVLGAGGGDVRPEDLPALAASGAVFMLVNTVLASAPPAFAHGATLSEEVRSDLGFQAWSTAVLVSLAPIVLIVVQQEPGLFPLIALPLAAIQLGARQAKINQHRARHDALTGLPNRVLLQERVAAALAQAGRRGETVAVLLLGLDAFNEVNQTLGHGYGDLLLREVARRLDEAGRDQDLVARFGGDEFAVLTGPLGGMDEAERLAHELLEALRPQAHLGGIALDVRATVGIAVHPRDGDDAELLLVRAAMALHAGKQDGRPVLVYDHASDDHTPERLALAGELRHAIEAGELLLSYQPKLDLRTARSRASRRSCGGGTAARGAHARPVHRARRAHRARAAADPLDARGGGRPADALVGAGRRPDHRGQHLRARPHAGPARRRRGARDSHPGARLEIELTETLMIEGASVAMDVVDALAATASAWRSTTSARATRRSRTSSACRCASSRSTAGS